MLATKTNKLTLTLFIYLIFGLAVASIASANGFSQRGLSSFEHKRLIKKRTPFPAANKAAAGGTGGDASQSVAADSASQTAADSNLDSGDTGLAGLVSGVAGLPPTPNDLNANSSASVSASASTASASASSASSASSSSVSATSSAASSASLSSASALSVSQSAALSVSSSPASSAAAVTPVSSAPSVSQPAAVDAAGSTVVQASYVTATPTENADVNTSQQGLSSKGKTALITVLIVVAASVGGVVIIWTIFRKWKLGASRKFDARLQPIDWQPTHDDGGDFRPHRHSGMSFQSGFGQSGYGATSNHGHGSEGGHGTLGPLPDHDFTAGPTANLAPVGGYADLARGPSPQPYMQERGNYNNQVPLHHQGYTGQY